MAVPHSAMANIEPIGRQPRRELWHKVPKLLHELLSAHKTSLLVSNFFLPVTAQAGWIEEQRWAFAALGRIDAQSELAEWVMTKHSVP